MFDVSTLYTRPVRSLGTLALILIGLWAGALLLGTGHWFKNYTNQPLADSFSAINALFAGLALGGVIITLLLQLHEGKVMGEEMEKTSRANQMMVEANVKMAARADERAVLDLFQTYCSEYFQGVKDSSMSVLIACVASKEYCDFVVSRFFVGKQINPTDAYWLKVSKVSRSSSYEQFKVQEQRDRYKLDELINFFTLLHGLDNSREAIARCDFSYSWWRPLLWMIAIQQEKRYHENAEVRKYATPLYLRRVLEGLDSIYGMDPFATEEIFWDFFIHHPKINSYQLDEEYREFAIRTPQSA